MSMKSLLFVFCILLAPANCFAQDKGGLDPETKEICNKTMLNIYYDIVKDKEKYKELSSFGEAALFENKHGIYTLIYSYGKGPAGKEPFAFGLTIDQAKDQTFKMRDGAFNLTFPILGLKFSGYQRKYLLRAQFNLMPLVERHGVLLGSHQQNYLPLRLFLKPLKDVYKVRENIEFDVVLQNVSKRNMVVKELGPETLFFLFNGLAWGSQDPVLARKQKDVVLRAGESLTMRLQGESFLQPQDVEINGLYVISIKGINPITKLTVRVEE